VAIGALLGFFGVILSVVVRVNLISLHPCGAGYT
jgi:hypothetical protein